MLTLFSGPRGLLCTRKGTDSPSAAKPRAGGRSGSPALGLGTIDESQTACFMCALSPLTLGSLCPQLRFLFQILGRGPHASRGSAGVGLRPPAWTMLADRLSRPSSGVPLHSLFRRAHITEASWFGGAFRSNESRNLANGRASRMPSPAEPEDLAVAAPLPFSI